MQIIRVPSEGPSDAQLAVVGEAPGANEERYLRPFCGKSGDILNECLEDSGLSRRSVYVTNVSKVRPPHNDIKKLKLLGYSIDDFLQELTDELNSLPNLNCILLVGGTALEAVTGNHGIEKYRGSILQSRLTKHKCVATLHPASLLHEENFGGTGVNSWKDLALIRHDISRAVSQSKFPETNVPERNLEIARNSSQVMRFFEQYDGPEHIYCASDIETAKTIPVCTSFAFNRHHAMSVPLLYDKISDNDLVWIWKIIHEFYNDTKKKFIAQNGNFDTKRCRDVGLKWHSLYFDTALAWKVLFPEFDRKLAVIASILTEESYYKDEGSEYIPGKHSFDRLCKYNAKDSAVTFECFEEEMKMFNEDPELFDFFMNRIMPLNQLYADGEDIGLLIDQKVKRELNIKYTKMKDERFEKLLTNILNGDTNLRDTWAKFNSNSPKQVANLLFGFLNCPVRKDVGEDTLKALANNNVKDTRRKEIIKGILEQRKIRRTIGTYITYHAPEGRCRTSFFLELETGRTSTRVRKPPVVVKKEGLALQTMTKHEDLTLDAGGGDLRAQFIADPGYTFIEADLSQAEDRVVCVLAEDWEALREYERKDFKYNLHGIKDDRHTKTAMKMCDLDFSDIRDYERQIGKHGRHAGNLAIGKHEMMLMLAGFGVFVSEWKCGRFLDKFHEDNPRIRKVFHQGIQDALANDRILVNPFGRKRQFFNKWGDELFKEAYAQIPQSTISDQTKFALQEVKRILFDVFFFVLESHDSFLGLIKDDYLGVAARTIKRELEKPINFSRCSLSRDYDLVIPCEIKVGKRWIEKSSEYPDGMEKYKL